jgi:hypothetical protein
MNSGRLIAIAAVMALIGTPSFALEPKITKWTDLAPEPVQYDNPFAALSPDQLLGLRALLRHKQGEKLPREELAALRLKLRNDGLDIDRLFAQREMIMKKRRHAATKTTDSIVGQVVRLPGYLLPLEIENQKAVEFLLVPTVGACIHTPPPPPNQMVHVRYPTGYPVQGLYSPIWVIGKLEAESVTPDVQYVDGQMQVDVGYAMNADSVEAYHN